MQKLKVHTVEGLWGHFKLFFLEVTLIINFVDNHDFCQLSFTVVYKELFYIIAFV